tara:strand:+ start:3725 stop:4261 length:537 start_codon:yes stop_codon:yes gene_type:complete
MQKILVPLVLCLAMVVGASAHAQGIRSPDMVIGSVATGDLHMLVDEMGATLTLTGVNDRQAPYVFAISQDGMSFGIYTACGNPDGTDCRGIEFLAVFDSERSIGDISAIDQSYAAVSVYKSDDKTVHVSRYVILDHGVTWANLIENAGVFATLCGKVSAEINGQVTAQFAPPPLDGVR